MLATYKDAGSVETEVLMMRTVHRGAFLLVEGPDDSRFWRAFVSIGDQPCEVIQAGSKTAVEGAMQRLDRGRAEGALGIVDDDGDSLLGLSLVSPNLTRTHTRDLEGAILKSGALHKALAEFGDPARIKAFVERRGPVLNALLELCLPHGRARLVSRIGALGIPFQKYPPVRYLDRSAWTLDREGLHEDLVRAGHFPDRGALDRSFGQIPEVDPWRIVHGHDLISVLNAGFGVQLGAREEGVDRLTRVLRAAVARADLYAWPLVTEIRAWEDKHAGYSILPP